MKPLPIYCGACGRVVGYAVPDDRGAAVVCAACVDLGP